MIVSFDTIIMSCKPPYSLSPKAFKLVIAISEQLGKYQGLHLDKPEPQLRRKNRIRSIHSSLLIEGNRLSEEQVSDILDGKRVLGPARDIIEVKNAIKAYDNLDKFKANRLESLLKAHGLLMQGLADDAGQLRSGNVGIFKGAKLTHMAPPARLVKKHISDLLNYLGGEEHALIKSCVFHYEFEFIHPFSDGNGRLGRLWQTLILSESHPVFSYLPIESLIKAKQKKYYDVLASCDKAADSSLFIEFMLDIILEAIKSLLKETKSTNLTCESRIGYAKVQLKKSKFKRHDYLGLFKNISTATASRDLNWALKNKLLSKSGERNQVKYQF